MGMGTLIVDRLATSHDLIEADTLYRDHAGEHLPVPDPDDLWEAIQRGELFGCRIETGALIALGGTFPLARCRHPAVEDARYPQPAIQIGGLTGPVQVRPEIVQVLELAGMVVHPALRSMKPIGVQALLVAVRVGILAQEQAKGVCLLSSVSAANARSLRNLQRCGLQELDPTKVPLWLDDLKRTWLPGRKPQVVDLVVRQSALSVLLEVWQIACSGACFTEAGDGSRSHYRATFGEAANIAVALGKANAVADWEGEVPAERLVGKKPPFLVWPRK